MIDEDVEKRREEEKDDIYFFSRYAQIFHIFSQGFCDWSLRWFAPLYPYLLRTSLLILLSWFVVSIIVYHPLRRLSDSWCLNCRQKIHLGDGRWCKWWWYLHFSKYMISTAFPCTSTLVADQISVPLYEPHQHECARVCNARKHAGASANQHEDLKLRHTVGWHVI